MYVNITGSANNKDVYIYQSFRKENGKTSSRIYKKLGKDERSPRTIRR